MKIPGNVPRHPDSITWQDYRAADTGMIIYYNTDPVSELPIREVPEEIPSAISPEPHYETGTYGFYGCSGSKMRSTFSKSKIRYLFFMTRYAGTKLQFQEELMITGFYRINWTADVQRLHMRYLASCSCMDDSQCIALRANELRFLGVDDGYLMGPEVLKGWNITAKITRQTRLLLDAEKTGSLLTALRSRTDITAQYIEETKRLMPQTDSDEEDGEAAE